MKPAAVQELLLCSYDHDASSILDRSRHKGCGRGHVYKAGKLDLMLRSHEARAQSCRQLNNINNCYNEVLLDLDRLSSRLPDAIEAFVFPLGASDAHADAQAARSLFLATFPSVEAATVPLLSFDRDQQSTPLVLVEPA